MLRIINDECQIKKLHKIFHERLASILTERHISIIGYPSGTREDNIFYSTSLGMWYVSSQDVDSYKRIWNSFGVQNPYETRNLNIAVEINFPFQRNGSVNGVFLVDDDNNIYIGHRGLVNIIRGKKSVLSQYATLGEVVTCLDKEVKKDIIIVSLLSDSNLAWNLKVFVDNIKQIKDHFRNDGHTEKNQLQNAFSPEATIITSFTLNKTIEQSLEHGRIVNSLNAFLVQNEDVNNS